MRILPMIVALGLGVALVVPAEAGFKFSVRSGGSASVASAQHGGSFWGERRAHRRSGHRSGHRRHRGFFLFPNYSGYRGRTGIYEMIEVDDTMRTMIYNSENEQAMLEQARLRYPGIEEDGRRRVLAGETSVEEVMRVTAVA